MQRFYKLTAALSTIGFVCGISACSTTHVTPPKPGIDVRYQRVEVPVSVPCVTKDQIPVEPGKIAGKLTGDARRDLDTVSASAMRLRAWGLTMAALLSGCAK